MTSKEISSVGEFMKDLDFEGEDAEQLLQVFDIEKEYAKSVVTEIGYRIDMVEDLSEIIKLTFKDLPTDVSFKVYALIRGMEVFNEIANGTFADILKELDGEKTNEN